jgi:hypothetical protein
MNVRRPLSALVLFAAIVGSQSCITDNPPAYSDLFGSERDPSDTGEGGNAGEVAGHGAGAPPASAGGAPGGAGEPGAGATGGSVTGEGGAAATGSGASAGEDGTSAGTTGMPPGNEGGSGGTGGTVVNPPTHPDFSPACFLQTTTAGDEIMKGTPCTAADPQLCYRPCGPNQVGWKTETCIAGVYAEGDCTFPEDRTYECYAIPDPIDHERCGVTAPPSALEECSAPECYSCNFEGYYKDTGTDLKEGYCVCRAPGTDGVRRWTCGSATAWPCPLHEGC